MTEKITENKLNAFKVTRDFLAIIIAAYTAISVINKLNYQVDAQAKTISDHETRIRSIEDIIVQISNLNKDITKLSEDMEDVKTQSIQNSSLKNDMRELISKLNNEDDNRRRKEIDRR